jgi:hypothetical protein
VIAGSARGDTNTRHGELFDNLSAVCQTTMITTYTKDVLIKGRPTPVRCVDIEGHVLTISGGPLRIAAIEDEWYDSLSEPDAVIEALRAGKPRTADILSFWNPLPDSDARFPFPFESEQIAVLPVASYEDWWSNRIRSRTRSLIRKAEKDGLVVREAEFDDEFCRGMSAIFNETPVRQGRKFWHYGKSPELVRQQFSRFIHRESIIGAYVNGELVGFIMLGNAGRCAHLGQIISKLSERHRATNNALVAKAVEICARQGNEYLLYWYWSDNSLTEFKRRCGFEPVPIPHYFAPLSARGEMALRLGLHRGLRGLVPQSLKVRLRQWRAAVYARRGLSAHAQ